MRSIWNRYATPIPPPVVCLKNKEPKVSPTEPAVLDIASIDQNPPWSTGWTVTGELQVNIPDIEHNEVLNLDIQIYETVPMGTIRNGQKKQVSFQTPVVTGTACIIISYGGDIWCNYWIRLDQETRGIRVQPWPEPIPPA